MKQYSSYIDSGIQWLNEIPAHWKILPGRALFTENKEKNDGGEHQVLSLSYGSIIIKKNVNEGLIPENYSSYQYIRAGYIIVRCTDLQNDKVSLRTSISEYEGIITGAYLGLIPKPICRSKFIHYLLRAWDCSKELYRYGSGLRQSLSWNDFKYLLLPIPTPEEQEAIVAYLDAATAKIDEAIAQQQRMIDLLNERKQIIINDAVSSGLGNEFSALTSFEGRESITIPKGWRLLPLKAKISFVNGYAFDSESFMKEGEVPVIRISNISDGTVSYDDIVYVDRDKGLEPFLTKGGDLLIAMSGATTGKVGFDIDGGSYINQRVGIIRSSCQKWVYYWLMTSFFKEYVYLSALGSAQPNISCSGIKNFRILYPEDGNYSNIVDRLDVICQEIDKALGAFQHQIDLLQERKQIIINDVVTGKVKVI